MNNKSNFQLLITACLAVVAFFVAGCDGLGGGQQPQKLQKVTLGIGSGLVMTPILIAEENDYFLEAGLDLAIKRFNSGKASFNDMLAGGVDISAVALAPVMFTSFDRQDYAIFATFTDSNHNVKLIGRKDRGIHSPEDLWGKKIGTTTKTSAHFFLTSFFIKNRIDKADLEIIDMKPPALPDALNKGEVDAIAIWEPFAHEAQNLLADQAIILPGRKIFTENINLLTMKSYGAEQPLVLRKILKAIDKACNFIKDNREESIAIVARKLELDETFVRDMWDEYSFRLSLEQNLLLTLEEQAGWAIDSGLQDKNSIPNYLDYIILEPMDEIKPAGVTIIH